MAQFKPSTQLAGITNLSLLATVKDGFVDHSFQRITHAKRLEAVLGALNALRLGQRESLRDAWALPDLIGRLDDIHEFRFTLVPPAPDSPDRRTRFLLSVTFDGGWEPYMRFIWRDLGMLLDLMFCHCERYPLAFEKSYADYIDWVRDNEVGGDYRAFYYVDAPVTVGDQRHLASGCPVMQQLPSAGQRARAALKPILTLYGLSPFFTGPEAGILLRAAHDIVVDVRRDSVTEDGFPEDSIERKAYRPQLAWFESDTMQRTVAPPLGDLHHAHVQGGILDGYPNLTDGVLVLLRVVEPEKAVATLRAMQVTAQTSPPDPYPYCNLAFTYAGLAALGTPQDQLALFPQEFAQGMEARCGLLGDLRGNHPNAWLRPKRYRATGAPMRIELSLVHVVLQLRAGFTHRAHDDDGVHVDFNAAIDRLLGGGGLEVLAREAMVRLPPPADHAPVSEGTAAPLFDHLGFNDGLSQPGLRPQTPAPAPAPAPERWSDRVSEGEVFLGHPNDRGDGPYPDAPNLLLHHGSFLVVRKLRQHVDVMLRQVCAQASVHGVKANELLEAMVGRRRSGTALAASTGRGGPNDFNFADDLAGDLCPLRSHVRRANPRNGPQAKPQTALHPIPRILRRGMAYGSRADLKHPDGADRGIVFMAYAASIAEQFEVLQRWLAGGNSTGAPSTDADPLLGVPQDGRARSFACRLGGRDLQIDLGTDPFVTLQWGLYLFAPSVPALRRIGRLRSEPAPAPSMPAQPATPPQSDPWQLRLESLDPAERNAAWAEVRRHPGGVMSTGYGVLAGSAEAVRAIFDNTAGHYSVAGYGARMQQSLGLTHLGMDPPQYGATARAVNAAIETITETEAFDLAYAAAVDVLAQWPTDTHPVTGLRTATLDLAAYTDRVLGKLCRTWFGVPDGSVMSSGGWRADTTAPPRCPGDVLSASRYVFQPRPSPEVQRYGRDHGALLLQAALDHMALNDGHFAAPLASSIEEAVRHNAGLAAPRATDHEVARTVIGTMFGFAPTVYGNARTVVLAWLRGPWWSIQLKLADATGTPVQKADAVIKPALTATMVQSPVPDMLWRTATRNHELEGERVDQGATVVVGVLSASQAEAAAGRPDPFLMFGGRRGATGPLHACPGYAMAIGVLKALMLAAMEAGTIRRLLPSPSELSVTVTLERP